MTTLSVAIDARNPGAYLAACGLAELVSHFDPSTACGWSRRSPGHAHGGTGVADVFEIETRISEQQIVEALSALRTPTPWSAVTAKARTDLEGGIGVWVAGVEVDLGAMDRAVIDHWFERAFVNGQDVVQRLGTKDGKGRWKFWAGQLDAKGIAYLVSLLVSSADRCEHLTTAESALRRTERGGSVLNIDPASTRSSIDRGFSANDAKADSSAAPSGRPMLELLAAIGASTFFPPRRMGELAPQGTVGFDRRLFRYFTWNAGAPLALARLLARGATVEGWRSVLFEASLGMMGQYTYLQYARPSGADALAGLHEVDNDHEDDTDE